MQESYSFFEQLASYFFTIFDLDKNLSDNISDKNINYMRFKMKKSIYLIAAAAILTAAANAEAKDHMKKNWLDRETADIEEDYHEAIRKIDKSEFSQEQKNTLKAQAEANKELALSQAKATDEQLQKNREARKNFISNSKHDKKHKKEHKIFKEIDDIL